MVKSKTEKTLMSRGDFLWYIRVFTLMVTLMFLQNVRVKWLMV